MDAADVFTRMTDLSLSDAAAGFAVAGVPVFPCVPGGKCPLVEHGFHEATDDAAQVAGWWRRWPSANIGIPTGTVSGVEVVDVDIHATGTGFPAFRAAHEKGLVSGWAALVRTPSGGLHAYYPADTVTPQSSWQAAKAHVDFRGAGGYIIAPPSLIARPNGARVPYRLIVASGAPGKAVDAAQLRDFLDPRPPYPITSAHSPQRLQRGADAKVLAGWVAARSEGERNRGLFWAACRLAEAGTPPPAAVDVLGPAAEHAGLGTREIMATIRSAYRATHPSPRREAPTAGSGVRRVTCELSGRVLS